MVPIFPRVISADSHVREPEDLWWNILGKKFGDRTPRLLDEYQGKKGRWFYSGRQVGLIGDGKAEDAGLGLEVSYVPEVRVKFQEEAGIEAEVMNPTLMMNLMQGDPEVVMASAEVYNDWMAEFSSYNLKRLLGVSTIPMYDIDWSLRELKRTAKKGLGNAMINVEPPEGVPPYANEAYDPFWATAQDLGVSVTLHIITGRALNPFAFNTPEEQRQGPRVMLDLCYEVMGVLANEFIFGGILDRFPDLKLVISEFEVSWVPNYMVRLDDMQRRAHLMGLPTLKMKASDYIRTRMWHGFTDDPYPLHAIENIGADAILWGSDFPHSRSLITLEAQESLTRLLDGLPKEDQEKVVGRNAAKVWGL